MLLHSEAVEAAAPKHGHGAVAAELGRADIDCIRDGFQIVAAEPDGLAAIFYARLFAIDPSLRAMFRSDLVAQGRKLTAALALVVRSLDRLDAILPALEALGARHAGYGVEAHHYTTVGQALLDTLRTRLGPSFDAEAVRAWTAAYAVVASAMLAAGEAQGSVHRHV